MIHMVLCLEINWSIVFNSAQRAVFLLDYNFCSKLLLLLLMNFSPYVKVGVHCSKSGTFCLYSKPS